MVRIERRALLTILFATLAVVSSCSKSSSPPVASASTPPVDVVKDESWEALWMRIEDEASEIDFASSPKGSSAQLADACRQVRSTVESNRVQLLNVSDEPLRRGLGKLVPKAIAFYGDCEDRPTVNDDFRSRLFRLTRESWVVTNRLDDLGFYVAD